MNALQWRAGGEDRKSIVLSVAVCYARRIVLKSRNALYYALDILSGVDLLDEDRETRTGAHSSQFTSGGGGNGVFGILSIVMHLLINPNQMGSSLL